MGSDGLFYTQGEVRDLIAYAYARGIRVVPEFDMPGHSTAWFVGHPELASGPGPYEIERKWGVFDPAMDPTREETYKFLDAFIGEMAGLFPDQFFHIGGDEVNGKEWDANPKIQQFMRAHNLKNNNDLQAYFNQRVQAIVSKHGKTMLGWDEVLRPDLPNSIAIQSWRGQDSLAAGGQTGLSGIAFVRILRRPHVVSRAALFDRTSQRRRREPLRRRSRSAFWAAKRACGRSMSRRKTLTPAYGRAPQLSPSGCGRRRRHAM